MSAEIPPTSDPQKPAEDAQIPPPGTPTTESAPESTAPFPEGTAHAVAHAPGDTIPPTPKRDIPLPDIVLGGSEPFNAAKSPLIRFIKLCTLLLKVFVGLTILTFMLYYYLSIARPDALPKYDPKTGAGPTPFKELNKVLAMPAQVLGKTKEVVATNDERVAELDHVIDVSEGKDGGKKRVAQGEAYRPPTVDDSAPAASEAAPAQPKSAFGQLLALPTQVVNQTKSVVDKNNSRVGTLDGVIANPDGIEKPGGKSVVNSPVAPGPKAKPAPPAKSSVNSQDTADLAQSLINFSLNQPVPEAETTAPTPGTPPLVIPSSPDQPTTLPPAVPAIAVEPKKVQLGGGVVITSPSQPGTNAASEVFFTWAMNVKINGVFPGAAARVTLNDRIVRVGDIVHVRLAITLDAIDGTNRLLLFRDKSGATVSRSY